MHPFRRPCAILLCILLLCALVCGCAQSGETGAAEEEAPAAIEVRVAYPNRADLVRETEFVGRVESGTSVNVFAEVPARILHTYKNVGEYVMAGELLMEVDNTDMQSALAGAEAALEAAELSYKQTEATQAISTSGSAHATKQLTNAKTLSDLVDNYYTTLKSGRELDEALDAYTVALWDATSANNTAQSAFDKVQAETVAKAQTFYTSSGIASSGITEGEFLSFMTGQASPDINLRINDALVNKLDLKEQIYQQQLAYTGAASAAAAAAGAQAQAEAALEAYEKQYDASASQIDSSIRTITKNYDYYARTFAIADTLGAEETAFINDITLATLQLNCDNAQRGVDTARRNLDKCKIYAPVSGIVSAKNAVESNFASAAAPMYVIAAEDAAPQISFSVSEDGADALQVGAPLTVIANGESHEATLSEISNTATAGSGLYAAKAVLGAGSGLARSGMVVKVRAATAKEENALSLPHDVIEYDGNTPYVLVYKDGAAERRDLELGMSTRTEVAVLSGLTAADPVITTWHPELKDGAAVYCAELSPAAEKDITIDVIE